MLIFFFIEYSTQACTYRKLYRKNVMETINKTGHNSRSSNSICGTNTVRRWDPILVVPERELPELRHGCQLVLHQVLQSNKTPNRRDLIRRHTRRLWHRHRVRAGVVARVILAPSRVAVWAWWVLQRVVHRGPVCCCCRRRVG